MPEAPTKYWRQLLGPALVSPHSYCVTRMSHERCVDVLPSAKVALWHTELASITTETAIAVQCLLICPKEKGKRLLFEILSFLKRSQQRHNTLLFLTRSAQLPHLMWVSCSDLFAP